VNSSITFINHATVLLQLDGVNILTDPTYNRSVGLVAPRMQKAGIPIDELPPVHLILISHNDYDHLSVRTLRKLRRRHQCPVIVAVGDGRFAMKAGFENVSEMCWWESKDVAGTTVHAVPAKHKSNRAPFQRNKLLCNGYVVERNGVGVYFAGDTGYGDHFKEIATRHAVKAALLPIGAYKPHDWFRELHLNPQTAIKAFLDLKAEMLIPIHWGTFKISDEPLKEPPILLMEEAKKSGVSDKVRVLKNGDTVSF